MQTTAPETSVAMAGSMPVDPYLKIRPPTGWAALNLGDVWRFRDLMMALASRDVKLRYKQTALGIVWVVLQPLMAAGIFSFVFGKLGNLPHGNTNSFLYSYVGLLGFNLFSGTLTKTSGCLVGNSQLISKIFFPRLVLPFSAVPSVLIDFAVALAMLAVLMLVSGQPFGLHLLVVPFPIALILLLSMGIGLITAALTVSYRDVQYILPVFTQILLYGSPVAYPLWYAVEKIPQATHLKLHFASMHLDLVLHLRPLYLLNPLAAPLEAFKASLLGTDWPSTGSLIYAVIASVGMLLIGAYGFKKMERKFADII